MNLFIDIKEIFNNGKRVLVKYFILILIFICPFNYLNSQSQHPIFPDLEGGELMVQVVDSYKPMTVLEYGPARDLMYGDIYLENDSVRCVYTGHGIALPSGVDPSTFLHMNGVANGINNEHTFPRSKGAAEENGNSYSDMHHLFPSRIAVNSSRGNSPFGEIEDHVTNTWYYLNQSQTETPSANIDNYSESASGLFEPRESHKGNVARAMFYFYTMYQNEANTADPSFFESQRTTLCQWHFSDPVDLLEYERTFKIATHQSGQPNPFILDCTLATRSFCQEIIPDCPELPIISSTENVEEERVVAYPNPVFDTLFVEYNNTNSTIQLFDFLGRILVDKQMNGKTALNFQDFPAGYYLLKVDDHLLKIVK